MRIGARVAELADALDLGSSELISWGFESPLSHHELERLMAKEFTEDMNTERKFAVSVSSPSECKRVLSIEIEMGLSWAKAARFSFWSLWSTPDVGALKSGRNSRAGE